MFTKQFDALMNATLNYLVGFSLEYTMSAGSFSLCQNKYPTQGNLVQCNCISIDISVKTQSIIFHGTKLSQFHIIVSLGLMTAGVRPVHKCVGASTKNQMSCVCFKNIKQQNSGICYNICKCNFYRLQITRMVLSSTYN